MKTGYFDADGNVLLVSEGRMNMLPPPGTEHVAELSVEATANNIYYDGAVKLRQPFDVQVSRNRIDNVPTGTRANGTVITDGVIEFDADMDQTVAVMLDHPHYLPETVLVETGP